MTAQPSAVFLDRDGTINVKAPEGDYVKSPGEVRMVDGSGSAIARLNDAGIPVVVVTNQRGIALGLMSEDDLAAVNARVAEEIARDGAHVDAWYHCPHEKGMCACRKPGTEMLERAARDHGIDLGRAVMVGDSASDVEAGRRVGATTYRIGGDVATLAAAVDAILA